jgi:DNA-binding response OmpR family regulator
MTAERMRVLIVDDEQPIVDLVRGYLEREGMAVGEATDGPSAVRAARELGPDIVILDLMMPGFDGLEACRQIRSFSDPSILMLTARSEEIDRAAGLSAGVDDYLLKPFSPRDLVARVKALPRRPRIVPAEPSSDAIRVPVADQTPCPALVDGARQALSPAVPPPVR